MCKHEFNKKNEEHQLLYNFISYIIFSSQTRRLAFKKIEKGNKVKKKNENSWVPLKLTQRTAEGEKKIRFKVNLSLKRRKMW